jgi:hypothetical protein
MRVILRTLGYVVTLVGLMMSMAMLRAASAEGDCDNSLCYSPELCEWTWQTQCRITPGEYSFLCEAIPCDN